MRRKLPKTKKPQHRISDETLTAGLHKTFEGKYGKILEAAKRKWEREFGPAKEPSHASSKIRGSGAAKKGASAPSRRKPQK